MKEVTMEHLFMARASVHQHCASFCRSIQDSILLSRGDKLAQYEIAYSNRDRRLAAIDKMQKDAGL